MSRSHLQIEFEAYLMEDLINFAEYNSLPSVLTGVFWFGVQGTTIYEDRDFIQEQYTQHYRFGTAGYAHLSKLRDMASKWKYNDYTTYNEFFSFGVL